MIRKPGPNRTNKAAARKREDATDLLWIGAEARAGRPRSSSGTARPAPRKPRTWKHTERFGTVVQSAATVRLSDVAADPETAQGVAGSIRTVATASDLLFVLNAVDEDLVTLAVMQQPMIDLFERIELLADDDAVTDAVRRLVQ